MVVQKDGHVLLFVNDTQVHAAVAQDSTVFEEARRSDRLIGVRADLASVPTERLEQMFEQAWRNKAPKRLVTEFDQGSKP